jgi:hypothetical protein
MIWGAGILFVFPISSGNVLGLSCGDMIDMILDLSIWNIVIKLWCILFYISFPIDLTMINFCCRCETGSTEQATLGWSVLFIWIILNWHETNSTIQIETIKQERLYFRIQYLLLSTMDYW